MKPEAKRAPNGSAVEAFDRFKEFAHHIFKVAKDELDRRDRKYEKSRTIRRKPGGAKRSRFNRFAT